MLSKAEELRLISLVVISDDRRAFARLIEAYQPLLHTFFLNLTAGDEALCDDLAQETFIKAYTNIRQFQGLAKFKTWLFRIGYNEFYSHLRHNREMLTEEPLEHPDLLGYDETSNDARMDLNTAMQHLSADERTVISLFYVNDLPIKKITAITGMPEGTIKSHISRAKAKLTKLLG